MSVVKTVLLVALTVAVAYFAPTLIPAIGSFFGASGFLAAAIGSLVLAVGVAAIQYGVSLIGRPQPAPMDAGKVNVRIAEPTRWIVAGSARQGGGALFGEYDASGNFWMVVVHADSILARRTGIFFDEIAVTTDANGWIVTDDFCLNDKKEPYKGSGTRVPYFRMWTTTHSRSNPTPPAIAELIAALPGKWTMDHRLVSTTYSVVMCKAINIEKRTNIYKWGGVFRLGEPNVSIVGDWSLPYDPRTNSYAFTRNPALIWAWFRTHPFGRRKSDDAINWSWVAEQADICDQVVTGIGGQHVRYECNASIPENKERSLAEQEILISADAQLSFDDQGRCWPRVGYYYAPTLRLTRNRDIVAMESVEAQNGESETQGVIVRYTDPAANYTAQPSAPWYNPNYYRRGETATFLTVDILACQNHNQAMRLAKAIGMRSQPIHKILPTVGLRGLRARKERIFNLNYDNTFAGDYEIVTPIEVDEAGIFCGFGTVPVDPNRWTLLTGEEKPKPVVTDADTAYVEPGQAQGVTVVRANGRIEARFNPPVRDDVYYEFQYIPQSEIDIGKWSNMTVNMVDTFAYSGPLSDMPYYVQYRTVTSGGRVSDWSEFLTVGGAANTASQAAILNSWILEVSEGQNVVTASSDGSVVITDHTRRYPDGHADVSVTGGTLNTELTAGQARSIGYDDPDRSGGTVAYQTFDNDNDARASAAFPGRHYVGYFAIPTTGSSGGGGGGYPGGPCVTADTPILMADGARTGAGASKVAADVRAGDYVWTKHETTMRFGAYRVMHIEWVEQPVYSAPGFPRATADHKFWIDGEWVEMSTIGKPDGTAVVAKISVDRACTYVSAGVLSHNIKMERTAEQ